MHLNNQRLSTSEAIGLIRYEGQHVYTWISVYGTQNNIVTVAQLIPTARKKFQNAHSSRVDHPPLLLQSSVSQSWTLLHLAGKKLRIYVSSDSSPLERAAKLLRHCRHEANAIRTGQQCVTHSLLSHSGSTPILQRSL